jgi:predicted MFS family arabinose efflux permease
VLRRSSLGRDFNRLWTAYSISEAGTALSAGALPLIATTVLGSSTLQVSLLAAVSGVVSALIALPFGGFIEHRRKRPVMVAADLARAAATVSIPVAALAGRLGFVQLCVVAVVQAAGTIAFKAASGAHLKALVPADRLTMANGRFESTFWTANGLGTPLGGAMISLFGATVTLAVDAVSFLLSALGIRRLERPEPAPPPRPETRSRWHLFAGWGYIARHRGLSALFWNSLLFGGTAMMLSPLMTVLMLRELHFAAWQFGLVMGLPCLAGVVGAGLAARFTALVGSRLVLLTTGVLRAPWFLLIPLAGPGTGGMLLVLAAMSGLLFSAGMFNPSFATYRMQAVADDRLARVLTSWSISSRIAQPLCIVAGGLLATVTDLHTALWIGASGCAASAMLLPWRR